jgi:hypothetical protein
MPSTSSAMIHHGMNNGTKNGPKSKVSTLNCDPSAKPSKLRSSISTAMISPSVSAQLHSTNNLDQLEPSFMYTQLFKDAFLVIDYDDTSKAKFVAYARNHFRSNPRVLNMLNEFANTYYPTKVICWYKHECFLFRMLNPSLRCMKADMMVGMSFFIHDLHQRIDRLHREQLLGYQ